jgi:hypothetical protein
MRSVECAISISNIRPDPSRGDGLLAQLRQSTFKDFHDDMNRFNQRLAFAAITSRCP